jgi:hypothetical protein
VAEVATGGVRVGSGWSGLQSNVAGPSYRCSLIQKKCLPVGRFAIGAGKPLRRRRYLRRGLTSARLTARGRRRPGLGAWVKGAGETGSGDGTWLGCATRSGLLCAPVRSALCWAGRLGARLVA